jgi:TPR repeat protein
MYFSGEGIVKDQAQGVRWIQRAADRGHASAQLRLAMMYEHGEGVERDRVRAHMWLSLSAKGGGERAAAQRDRIARSLSAGQLARSRQLARDWEARATRVN